MYFKWWSQAKSNIQINLLWRSLGNRRVAEKYLKYIHFKLMAYNDILKMCSSVYVHVCICVCGGGAGWGAKLFLHCQKRGQWYLFYSLVLAFTLYCLPNGMSVNSVCRGWLLSFWWLYRLYRCWLGLFQRWAAVTTLCRALLFNIVLTARLEMVQLK